MPIRSGLVVLLLPAIALAGCLAGDNGDDGAVLGDRDGEAAPLFAALCPGDGQAWPDPCTMLASPNESPSKTEIDLVVNPTDPRNVFVASKDLDVEASDCVWAVGQVTKDAGATWTTVYVGGTRDAREPILLPFACITDPIMVFDADGTLYYALQAYRLGVGPENVPALPVLGQPVAGSTFILARSGDGGATFDHFVLQHIGDGVAVFHDYPRMLVNPSTGSVCTIWNGVGSGGVTPWVSCSRDGGETVDEPVTFSSVDGPRSTSFESGFAALADGTVFVTAAVFPSEELALAGGGDEMDVRLFRSDDDARSFTEVGPAFTFVPTPRQLETNEFRTPSFVEMASDATGGAFGGRLHVFYPDYSTGDSDVLSRWSDDGGVTWSDPVPIHTNRTNDQFMMRPRVGPDGTVHVVFYDRHRDPENRLVDAAHAWSTDGGVTWRDQLLTATPFDGDLGVHQNGFPFIGDYNGIDVVGDHLWIGWADTRSGRAEIAVAHLMPTSAAP